MNIMYRRPTWMDYVLMIAGTGSMAVAIQYIFDPVGLVTGGFTGIAIIIKKLTEGFNGGVPLWLTNLVLNVPLFFIAAILKGKRFVWRTIFATLMLSGWLFILPSMTIAQNDYVISAIFGGVLTGAGMGLILLARATTGGTDMLAVLIHIWMKHISVVRLIMVVDGMIVILGIFVFGIRPALYSLIAIYCMTKISDFIMEGMKNSKAVHVISEQADEIANRIMRDMDRGVTGITSTGMYSGKERRMLYCVVSKKEVVELKDIVLGVDPSAFVIVTDAREVLGEGFLEY